MSYRDYKELKAIDEKDRRATRKIRKKTNWGEGRYCNECFYSLLEDEEKHENCLTASRDSRRKINPNMMKILKERKRNSG